MARYLVTGGGGFIGSNLVHALLVRGQHVRVLDDFSTGKPENLADVLSDIELAEGSICDKDLLPAVFKGVDYCLHLAALPSVPRSIEAPWQCNRSNVEGSINVLLAARDAGVRRVVVASSSSVYGNAAEMPASETAPIAPISPYGVSKAAIEMYARVFAGIYRMDIVALRYFNVFGPRQDPNSAYAAVIPAFIRRMRRGECPHVDGDGLQGRDFTYVANVVDANIRVCEFPGPLAGTYNIACGATTTILGIANALNAIMGVDLQPEFGPPRPGDIRQSYADISKAEVAFGYRPLVAIEDGLAQTVAWFDGATKG
ncbi:MAG: NAD-dependent epimerase/dehydratase family protein [Candidatus Hydrogenedentes bacterium]|nr:NAD-dependent epimerase/dehydratase family protein [Candidatus Hydrogenedentota bacterium]